MKTIFKVCALNKELKVQVSDTTMFNRSYAVGYKKFIANISYFFKIPEFPADDISTIVVIILFHKDNYRNLFCSECRQRFA